MPNYKVIYFNGRGRAELLRLLFAYAGQEYEDFRIQREEWPTFKLTAPFGQMPMMEIKDGDETLLVSQSMAMSKLHFYFRFAN